MCKHMLPTPSMCRWWCKLHAATYANTCRYVFGHHTPTHMHTHKHTHCQTLFTDQSSNAVGVAKHCYTATHAALYTHGCYNIALLAVFVAQHCYTATHATHWAHSSSELISNLHHHKLRYCSRPCTMPRAPLNITTTATDLQVTLAVWQVWLPREVWLCTKLPTCNTY